MSAGYGDKILPISSIPCNAVEMREGRGRLWNRTKTAAQYILPSTMKLSSAKSSSGASPSGARSSGWIMAESQNYILKGEYEEAVLYRKSDNARIAVVGDFYGDPNAGIIDSDERFCVTVGCGVIVYRLQDPFENYMYDTDTTQWYEFGRDPKSIDWIDEVRQIGPDKIKLIDASGKERTYHIRVEFRQTSERKQ